MSSPQECIQKGFSGLAAICGPIVTKAAGPLQVASRGSRAILPVTVAISALRVLAAANKTDQLANEVCSIALGTAGAAIGGSIGALGGPIGMVIGAGAGGVAGGLMGDWGYDKIKEWLFTKGEDGLRPIDRIANTLKAATDTLKAISDILAILMRGRADTFGVLLENWQKVGGLGGGPESRAIR